jgi:hypothetical protein
MISLSRRKLIAFSALRSQSKYGVERYNLRMKWSIIRALGKVKYFNASYVVLLGVPLLAEVYAAIHKRIEYPDFPPSLKLLYLASICYAIGIALYQYFCPAIIKMYSRDTDYFLAEKEVHLNARPDRKLEIVLANLLPQQKDTRSRLEELMGLKNPTTKEQSELDLILETQYPSSVQRFLLADYRRNNTKFRPLIFVCGLFYVVGTGIMLWLLVQKSMKVLEA